MGQKKGHQKPVLGGARSSGPSRAKNGWNEFQALHRGRGFSQEEMRQLYKAYKEGVYTMPDPEQDHRQVCYRGSFSAFRHAVRNGLRARTAQPSTHDCG